MLKNALRSVGAFIGVAGIALAGGLAVLIGSVLLLIGRRNRNASH